jgi:hypothetical protein
VEFLNAAQCSAWLKHRAIHEAPYGSKVTTRARYLQFAPPNRRDCRAFVAALFGTAGDFSGALLQLTDWVWDPEHEPDPTAAFRESSGESKALIELPGFQLDRTELPLAIDLGALVVTRGWTGYVYLESRAATFLLWEGDLIDFWTKEKGVVERLRGVLQETGARVVHDRGNSAV